MAKKSTLFAGAALCAILYAVPAMGEENRSLDERVRALEQALGIEPAASLTLEQRVKALEDRLAQGSPAQPAQTVQLAAPAPMPRPSPPSAVPAPAVSDQPVAALAQRVEQNEQASQAQQTRLATVEQKIADTTVTGRMYYNLSTISQTSDGVGQPSNGVGFDAKRFYVSVDHRFNDIFSGDITTDFNYISADKETQLFIKKAYLQATLSDAVVVRLGSADLPWVPFVEDIYGYRYLENILEERPKFGTSADWGVHVLGKLGNGLFNYQISAVNGGGYKQLTRSESMDIEARVNFNYRDFTLGLGGYAGKLDKDVKGSTALHTATRFDAIAAYTGMGARIGIQYMQASNWNNVTTLAEDSADGYSAFASYQFAPKWAVFGRYDWVRPSRDINPDLRDKYYNVGITYSPARIVDFSLVYKREEVTNGFLATTNGTIGGLVNAPGHSGTYDEAGLFGQFRW